MTANDILLVSEKFVKSITDISDNIAGKFLQTSIREAQEIYLRRFLGDCLLLRLKQTAFEYSQSEPEPGSEDWPYYILLTAPFLGYYLAYEAVVLLIPRVSYKVSNFGLAKSSDENLQVATPAEIDTQREYYQGMADNYALNLLEFVWASRDQFPELTECDCANIQANLRSAASCGIWLGGPRAKMNPSGSGCCKK